MSTVAAEKNLIAADLSRAKRKKIIDKMAAVYILQGYLDSLTKENISMANKDFDNEENFDEDIIVEMTDEEGNVYYYSEELVIPIGDDRFAILVEVHEEGEEHEHHCHCGECGDDCECDEGDVIIAKIVLNEEGEEEYIEPTDEEFEAVQKAYEQLMYEADED